VNHRVGSLDPERLTTEQQAVYDAVAGGERSKGPQHFPLTAADGKLHGPFGLMLHSPVVGAALAELGATLRFHTSLPGRAREIVILLVAQATGSEFEWWAHSRVAKAIGFSDDELMRLAVGELVSDDELERAVGELAANLLTSGTVTDDEFARVSAVLSTEQIVDVTTIVGYYRTLAQLMAVFAIGIPEEERPPAPDGDHHHHAH
jgi:4-carboxymuconolactone decarboxylase